MPIAVNANRVYITKNTNGIVGSKKCALCNIDTGGTSLVFKKSDIIDNSLIVPNQITENDVVCVNCFNQLLKNPKSNTTKARIDILVNILEEGVNKNEVNFDTILEKIETQMSQWSLSEIAKTEYLTEVMDVIEVSMHDDSNRIYALNQIRNMLALNFDVKSTSKI